MVDLQPFCASSKTDPTRPYLWAPFRDGDWTYATNGHILVRVPKRDSADVSPALRLAALLADLEPRWVSGTFAPLPSFEVIPGTPAKACRPCGGIGRLKKCTTCRGLGEDECWECGHLRECPTCKGAGGTRVTSAENADVRCDLCSGDGQESPKGQDIARFAEHDFDARYVELIQGLPRLEVAFGDGQGMPQSILVFRFDGGVGALTNMNTRHVSSPTSEAA